MPRKKKDVHIKRKYVNNNIENYILILVTRYFY